ncbi:MAG: DHH family phosphoesterase [Clostridia bacterium]|nr:DHH family phosphoesterase [Clostridia bacterium]
MKNKSSNNFISLVLCLTVMYILAFITLFFNVVWGITQILCAGILTLLCIAIVKQNHGHFKSYIDNITFHADTATRESMIYAPMPVAIIKKDGRILWYNEKFDAVFDDKELFDAHVDDVFEKGNITSYFEGDAFGFDVQVCDKYFYVTGNGIRAEKKDAENSFVVMYMFDITDKKEIAQEYENQHSVVAIACVDNYDDILMSTPDTYRSLLLAELDKKIFSWFASYGAMVKKYERDKYLIIFRNEFFAEIKQQKFSVIDEVKEIKCGNKFAPTLSIGIGVDFNSLQTADDYANSALTLALGRGGDQVIIKDSDNVSYYGGKTREHEKTTKVKARVTALALKELLSEAKNVVVMGHEYPDMDSIGASVGICAFARSLDVKANFIYDYSSQPINMMLERIKTSAEFEEIVVSEAEARELITPETLIVVVDTHRPVYTDYPEILESENNVVLIDHHRRGAEFISNTCLVYHEPYASSTCELVTELLQYAGSELKLSSQEAEALFAGIMLDTKDFAMKTGVRTFEAAAFLKRCGVDIETIRKFFRNDFENFVKIAKVVAGAEVVGGNIAIAECKKSETTDSRAIVPQAADRLLSISGIEASFVIMELEDETIISGRSTGEINVQLILEKIGGGGHLTMAGAQLEPCSFNEAKIKLMSVIELYLAEQK